MACRLAENLPLQRLRAALDLPATCHSLREDCLHSLVRANEGTALAAPGAVIGYCQALFQRSGSPQEHTLRVADLLKALSAPWHLSHELAWSQRLPSEPPIEFFNAAVAPLVTRGRVPIFITPLRAHGDGAVLTSLFNDAPSTVDENEPVLVRVLVTDDDDMAAISRWILQAIERAKRERSMPRWWPLIQSSLGGRGYEALRASLGEAWAFANIAVNPFTDFSLVHESASQITVAQLPVGGVEDIANGSWIGIPQAMPIFAKGAALGYDIDAYAGKLAPLEAAPTLIVLGPSLVQWDDAYNSERLRRFVPHMKAASAQLWGGVSPAVRDHVWSMAA